MSVSQDYEAYVRELFAWVPGLGARRMFGGVGLSSEGANFAVLIDDTLYLKADESNREMYQTGGAEIFRYLRQGKTQTMNYWSVPGDVIEDMPLLRIWAESALAAALKAK
ncbi:MAG: TfoX/Sxy family protein [Gammaproteobacteria bacterium]|nr:TfoX/Sxy family protein [Gammaproteobacteria bacterium]MCP5137726.1 TfoX/Sxy family protein [Gammaproteobacteria bacterium]